MAVLGLLVNSWHSLDLSQSHLANLRCSHSRRFFALARPNQIHSIDVDSFNPLNIIYGLHAQRPPYTLRRGAVVLYLRYPRRGQMLSGKAKWCYCPCSCDVER
jgi:hypothetical protein